METFKYGYNFQIKLIHALWTDNNFYNKLNDIFNDEYFESDYDRFIFRIMRDYHSAYQKMPTVDVLKMKISEIPDEMFRTSALKHLHEAQECETADEQFIKDETTTFCRNQELKSAIETSAMLLRTGNFDGIKELIDKASQAGQAKFVVYDYVAELERRYTECMRTPIATPWDVINDVMAGGLAGRELGIVVGGPGAGKCVGGKTTIEIEYDEIGLEISNGKIMWIKPWDKLNIDGIDLYGWQVELLFQELEKLPKN